MLCLMMGYADNWIFNASHLMTVAQVGRDKFQRIMRELINAGYLRREVVRGEGGRVSGSTWLIIDAPDIGPENLVIGATNCLKNRPLVKPTAGKTSPLRKPTNKKTKREECVGVKSDPAFDRFWSIYPRPRDRERSLNLFLTMKSQGIDPEMVVAAAEEYCRDNKGNGSMYLCFSDNWLADGRWKDAKASKPLPESGHELEETARFIAEKVKAGSPVFSVSSALTKIIEKNQWLTKEQMRAAGIS